MFDIYKLSPSNEGKGSIKAVYTHELKRQVVSSVKRIKSDRKITKFCKEVGIHYTTFWDYLNRTNSIPLFLLKKLDPSGDFQKHIKYLEYGTGSTKRNAKAVKSFGGSLAKILGAFVADGHLKKRTTKWNNRKATHYELVYREGYKSNVYALYRWLRKVFDISAKPKYENNHYCVYISNKIIFRYFKNIFGFNSGRKTETVSVPQMIKSSDNSIKRSFVMGVLMFDGSVTRSNGYIELYSKSRKLIKDVSELLEGIKIRPDYVKLEPDNFKRYRLIVRKQNKLRKSVELFEPGTEKWNRLNKCISNFKTGG